MLGFKTKYFLTGEELSQRELLSLLTEAESMRKNRGNKRNTPLSGKHIALIFDKPSLRTRLSFTVGISELGGEVLELQGSQKKTEDPEDTIRVLQGMVHGVMVRTFAHASLERMAEHATIPVINGLSDSHHPCQGLADLLTLKQKFGRLKGLTLSYVGDGNNVLHSLLLLAPYVGVNVHYACPKGYEPDHDILERAHMRAMLGGAKIRKFATPHEAVQKTHAIYTDVWASMGFEKESGARLTAFAGYQVDLELVGKALPSAIVMHCLPMNKGQEISHEVAQHPQFAGFAQSENRLHVQKALLQGIYTKIRVAKTREDVYEFADARL